MGAEIKASIAKLLESRFGGLFVFVLIFLVLSFALRVALLLRVVGQADLAFLSLVKMFTVGFAFDLAAVSFVAGLATIFYIFLPDRLFRWKTHRFIAMAALFLGIFVMVFDLAAEWLFWEEFTARFNFVAVDYLIYTTELFKNIYESYPVFSIIGAAAAIAASIFLLVRPLARLAFDSPSTFRHRLAIGAAIIAVPLIFLAVLGESDSQITDNRLNNELSKNGLYSFVAAFRNNTIEYKDFYVSIDDGEAFSRIRKLLASPDGIYVTEDPMDLRRNITATLPKKKYNVVLIIVESLSAKFLGSFGNPDGLTPNLDRIAEASLLFTNFYSTGTRTDRALEAIALSLPPTPGRSIVKRPKNENMFSLGQIFNEQGYDVVFSYGGYGYFDNMNAFFSGNGFRTVDRADISDEETMFANAWGVCDEDLLNRVMRECDKAYAEEKPFFNIVLTTSNHRPFTFPEGKVDMEQGHRNSVVKYTDYAIGAFLEKAKAKPWFDDTVFIVVADHCASSAGKVDVEVSKYHIPLMIYAPKLIQPKRIEKLSGQIDLPPTLLGLMGFSYRSKFFGRDILADGSGRALLGNYQKIGFLDGDVFTLLLPKKGVEAFAFDGKDQIRTGISQDHIFDTVSYYQTADYLISHGMQNAE